MRGASQALQRLQAAASAHQRADAALGVRNPKAHCLQSLINAPADHFSSKSQVLGSESHVIFHARRNYLIIWMLEDHPDHPAKLANPALIACVDTIDRDRARIRQQNAVRKASQG